MSTQAPLNGSKVRPLSDFAREQLQSIKHAGRMPRQELNPGVADRLLRGNLVTSLEHPSPYKTHKGRNIEHLAVTDEGLNELAKYKLL